MSHQESLLPPEVVQPAPACWYCGGAEGPWEQEHQLPVSRGGGVGSNIVDACARCNHLKGKLTVEEFRQALAARLGLESVVFAGEATPERPATHIRSVRTLQGDREVTRLDPVVSERLERAVMYLRRTGNPRITRKDIASSGVDQLLDQLAGEHLGEGMDFPASVDPVLFETPAPPIFRPGENSQTPKVQLAREVTRIDGARLERLRRAVEVLRRDNPKQSLTELINHGADLVLAELESRYPDLRT